MVCDHRAMLQLVSLAGIFVLLGVCYAFSTNRKAISWRLVISGMTLQAALGGVFLYWDTGNAFLWWLGEKVKDFLGLSSSGTEFVWGELAKYGSVEQAFPGSGVGFIFATQVLPTLIFFSSLLAVLYHIGLMQLVVRGMAYLMAKILGTSGSESMSACGNIFVGQTEAPLLVRPFLANMTKSELHAIMVGGFATIAGGVFALYVGFGIEPGHLMVASVMAVPAGLVCSKLMVPETKESETMGRVVTNTERTASNTVEAAANGAIDGLHLALNVGAMLIAFLGLMAVADWMLVEASDAFDYVFHTDTEPLTLARILGWVFYPVAAVMGVPSQDIESLAQLLGKKLILTELIAYRDLGVIKESLDPRTVKIASFALCGFANVGSVAIQIGGLGAMAPERKAEISKLAFRAMFTGAIATCITACLAGAISA